mmetsp:Transcript_35990/g.94429  ORF Transcript_35990/g.94429 Transcript_35990/m.94429 type:complete len:654 (+) Transcript_35990:38-1999(+)
MCSRVATVAAAVGLWTAACTSSAARLPTKPHLVYILADDFGHYDVGFGPHGSPYAPTPTLNQLASEGIVLDRFHAYKFCSPTRCSFLSGRLPIHVNTANRPSSAAGGVDLRMSTIGEQLASRGYFSGVAGKWHGGGYFDGQLPIHRGFNRSLFYINGNEDHFTQYFGILSGIDLFHDDSPAIGMNGTYGTFMYTAHTLATIEAFSTSGAEALFLYIPYQNTHAPNEAPEGYLNKSITATESKQVFFGMISILDQSVANITSALREKGLWENLLLVFSADNGGEQGGPGNNYPLRGGKYTDFEGGVRQAAFAAGGLIPAALHNTVSSELIHICDMWATFSALAGAATEDRKAAAMGGVPPVDSVDVSAVFFESGGKSPREVVVLSTTAVTKGAFKLVHESTGSKNIWVPPHWPAYDLNGSATGATRGTACNPCLFNVVTDFREETNLAGLPQYADTVAELMQILNSTVPFQTGDDGYIGNYTNCTTNPEYKAAHDNFIGPLCYECTVEPCPPPPPPPGPKPAAPTVMLRSVVTGLCVQSNGEKQSGVSLTSCNNGSAAQQWIHTANLELLAGGTNFCIRPTNPPKVPASCVAGHGVMVGLNACLSLSTRVGRLVSADCPKLCAVPTTDHTAVALEPCGSTPVWELVNGTTLYAE